MVPTDSERFVDLRFGLELFFSQQKDGVCRKYISFSNADSGSNFHFRKSEKMALCAIVVYAIESRLDV